MFRSIFLRAFEDVVEPASDDDRRRRKRKNTPASRSATPSTEPTTAPAMAPLDTPLRTASCVSALGFATIGVDVTVWVTGAPDTVITRVLTTVVWVHDEPLVEEAAAAESLVVVTAATVGVALLDVVDDGVVLEDVEVGVVDVDVGVADDDVVDEDGCCVVED